MVCGDVQYTYDNLCILDDLDPTHERINVNHVNFPFVSRNVNEHVHELVIHDSSYCAMLLVMRINPCVLFAFPVL